ncbi:hypothetical protein Aple_011770 [Acrocarpospora pleiomorpha]|uniref:DUF4367 domain-containing protein n=1 Tax=Acrocarpospora pleiomorpha TaxID=90975 RepID=A0A5M3XBY9_9ACTN|nr:hypothetical protein [Acrocarpospora pleiomorpha]GES18282.1 hypothetical protein Aple_011770 [Acrocarpospora pleiomorpha]
MNFSNDSDDISGFGELEDELRALSDALAVPEPSPPADVARAVRATLERDASEAAARGVRQRFRLRPSALGARFRSRGSAPEARRRFRSRIAAIVAAFLVVLVAATPQGRAAVVSILRFAGVEIRVGEPAPLPSGAPSPLPGERRVTLPEARTQVRFPLLVPTALGDPADVRIADGGRVVSMFWPGIRLDQYDGRLQSTWRKELGPPWPEEVTVDGVIGIWIQQPHGLQYTPATGPPQDLRLAGPTLIWQHGPIGMRLEGPTTTVEARQIANSVR